MNHYAHKALSEAQKGLEMIKAEDTKLIMSIKTLIHYLETGEDITFNEAHSLLDCAITSLKAELRYCAQSVSMSNDKNAANAIDSFINSLNNLIEIKLNQGVAA